MGAEPSSPCAQLEHLTDLVRNRGNRQQNPSLYEVLLMGDTWFFLLRHVKNYRSTNLLVCNQFISDLFPWKRTGPGRVAGVGRGKAKFKGEAGQQK